MKEPTRIFLAKIVWEHFADSEKVINKVHYILKSLDMPIFRYDSELNDPRDMIFDFSES